ncbi:unnamed protein product [Parascedosporium putredinis]|uniref:Uncharacterized protein n=1 Tax=Parascedosporium putredinis TaxID=1442378 RepID=A0A9P1GW76_9PEZI|nr:unnamed protein product [Parascedosporium putredinis]CAI7988139.1 unnamed protein product [Parascedosporium putredinis]
MLARLVRARLRLPSYKRRSRHPRPPLRRLSRRLLPVALTPAIRSALADLALRPDPSVSYIIAPDIEHHIFISDWKREWPAARLLGPEGLPEKRARSDPEFSTFDVAFDHDFEVEYVDAHPNRELVFYYKPDRVLIQADLMFNLPATEQYSRAGPGSHGNSLVNKIFAAIGRTDGDLTWARRVMCASPPDFNLFKCSVVLDGAFDLGSGRGLRASRIPGRLASPVHGLSSGLYSLGRGNDNIDLLLFESPGIRRLEKEDAGLMLLLTGTTGA